MRTLRVSVLIVVCLAARTGHAAPGGTGITGLITAAGTDAPLEGANVLVVEGRRYVASATTDVSGHYLVGVRPGTYDVVLVSGRSRQSLRVTVAEGTLAIADGQLASGPSEVIVLEDRRPPAVIPQPKHFSKRKLLDYSDEAILSDAWTKAWFLLDISPAGKVTRVKFLKRPGHDLDDIALRAAFAMSFEPGRDGIGRPVRVSMIWSFEWPANSFVLALTGLRTAKPEDVGFPPRPADLFVPCEGNGPMRLGSMVYKGYKDCSRPDLTKIDGLPWIDAPPR